MALSLALFAYSHSGPQWKCVWGLWVVYCLAARQTSQWISLDHRRILLPDATNSFWSFYATWGALRTSTCRESRDAACSRNQPVLLVGICALNFSGSFFLLFWLVISVFSRDSCARKGPLQTVQTVQTILALNMSKPLGCCTAKVSVKGELLIASAGRHVI